MKKITIFFPNFLKIKCWISKYMINMKIQIKLQNNFL
jgi:hypothetical protein